MSGSFRQIAIVAFTALMLFTNVILGSGSFNSDAAFDQADSIYYLYQTPLTPAVFTFIIWGPIFLGVLAIAVLQALPRYRHTDALNSFAPFYCGALIANAATPFTPIGWGLLAVMALLVCLVIS